LGKAGEAGGFAGECAEKIALFLALGAFTGMRSSEILRLDWLDLNFERRFITVAPEKAKTASRRLVPILSNLMAWLGALSRPKRAFVYESARCRPRNRFC